MWKPLILLLSSIIVMPSFVQAAPRTFSELAEYAIRYINAGVGVAIILGLVIYFYGIATGIASTSRGEGTDLSKRILWGMLALFVMVSVWGIVGLVRNSLFGGGGGGDFGGGGVEEFNCIDAECLI